MYILSNMLLSFISGNNWWHFRFGSPFMDEPEKRVWRYSKEESIGVFKRLETI